MLKRIALTDFKSFVRQSVELAPLTLLVGANASGKSNLLDALRVLQGLAKRLPLNDVLAGRQEGGREVWPGIRGGSREAARAGTSEFEIRTAWQLDGNAFEHRIACRAEARAHVLAEELDWTTGDRSVTIFRARSGKGNSVEVSQDDDHPAYVSDNDHSSLSHYGLPPSPIDADVTPATDRLVENMREMLFLDVMPSRMRSYVPRSRAGLGENAENISAVVYAICRDEQRKQSLVDWISELCAPAVTDIEFSETDLGDVMLKLVESDGTRISARSLSDGTLRFLGLLVAVTSLGPGSILVVEEIENGLHPARINLLLEKLAAETARGGRQVIATTHSPALLGALPEEHLGNVIVFGRSPEAPGTLMMRLRDLPHFGEIEARRGIEALFWKCWGATAPGEGGRAPCGVSVPGGGGSWRSAPRSRT